MMKLDDAFYTRRVDAVMSSVVDGLAVDEHEGLGGLMNITRAGRDLIGEVAIFLDNDDVEFAVDIADHFEHVRTDSAAVAVLEENDG